VLSEQYAKWKDRPAQVDLASMWKDLGIAADGKNVRVIQDAPLADVRRAIMAPEAPNKSSSVLPSAVFAGRASATFKPRS
jgi:hypothetical protein